MKAKKIVVFVVGLLLLMVFLSLMFTYQVRSNEIVLVQAWGGGAADQVWQHQLYDPESLEGKTVQG